MNEKMTKKLIDEECFQRFSCSQLTSSAVKSIQGLGSQLKFLYLNGCNIRCTTYLPLNIEQSICRGLPQDLFYFVPTLTWIDLRDNSLINLPYSIGNHPTLKVILLDNNLLTSIPSIIQTLPQLKTLTHRDNILTSPPDTVLRSGLDSILSWLREHDPFTMPENNYWSQRMVAKDDGQEQELRDRRRRSRSRSVVRISQDTIDEDDEDKENVLRYNDRIQRRDTIQRKRILKKLLIRNQRRKSQSILNAWHAWTQARIYQRHVMLNKCRAIEYICGKHIKNPENSSCEMDSSKDDGDEDEATSEVSSIALGTFKSAAQRVIENIRSKKIVEHLLQQKKEREAFERNCFQFTEDTESALYRKFLKKWSNTWDVWGSRGKAMAIYYQTMCTDDLDQGSQLSSPTITITDTAQGSEPEQDVSTWLNWAENTFCENSPAARIT